MSRMLRVTGVGPRLLLVVLAVACAPAQHMASGTQLLSHSTHQLPSRSRPRRLSRSLTNPAAWFVVAMPRIDTSRLCAVSLTTGKKLILLTTATSIQQVAHDGRWLAWLAAASMAEEPPLAMNVVDLATGQHRSTSLSANAWDMTISQDQLAWEHDISSTRSTAVVTDMSSGASSLIAPYKGSHAAPALSYPWAAWSASGKTTTATWFDLKTRKTGSAAASDSGGPLLSGHWLVWCAPTAGDSSAMHVEDLQSGTVKLICASGGRTEQSSDAAFSAPWVAWYDYSANVIRAMNVATGQHLLVASQHADEDGLEIHSHWVDPALPVIGGRAYSGSTLRSKRTLHLSADPDTNGPWVQGDWVIGPVRSTSKGRRLSRPPTL